MSLSVAPAPALIAFICMATTVLSFRLATWLTAPWRGSGWNALSDKVFPSSTEMPGAMDS